MRNRIEFLLGEEAVSLAGFVPELTVLDWLRGNGRLGTKEGCAEGDCGACTVVVAERAGDGLRYRAVNSCIQPMVSLDGRQLITVEDLADKGVNGTLVLHPVQEAMVTHHGSQCGFCTPGFVMSMFAMTHQPRPGVNGESEAINEALAGNLCRCTGYAPIVRACRDLLAANGSDRFECSQEETIRRLNDLPPAESLEIAVGGRQMLAPRSLEELTSLLERHPEAVMVAGATDVGLWLTKDLKRYDTMIYLGNVSELLDIEVGEGHLDIGAVVTYSDALESLTAHFPHMRDMLSRLGGLQVRNVGTIGGNIANGSPIGDMPPALIVLGARLVITGFSGSREIDLENFFIEYDRQDLEPGECVHKVRVPLPPENLQFRAYKLSKRLDQDISAVLGAYAIRLDGGKVAHIRIAYGGMAGIPARARSAEEALAGQPWSEISIDQACEAMRDDFTPLSDWRASAGYRMLAAQNLLRRFFLETSGAANE
jgi:xanthine dehydrogenase small subunit